MEENKLLSELNTIFQLFFKDESLSISFSTSANDIAEWDSLNHMALMSEVEKKFGIEFDFFELMEFQNIKDLMEAIQKK